MTARLTISVLAVASLALASGRRQDPLSDPMASDPIALLVPAGSLDAAARAHVDSGGALVDTLPARGRDLAAFGAVRTTAGGEDLVAWARRAAPFQPGTYRPQTGRFSDPPTLEDRDLDDMRRCRPGDCGVKLAAPEILRLREAIAQAGQGWRAAAAAAFREILVRRAEMYLAGGHGSAEPYHDHKVPLSPALEFAAVLDHVHLDGAAGAGLTDHLLAYPRWQAQEVESFLYWSKETLGGGKPIVTITHVNIVRSSDPRRAEALVAAKQVFATHYVSASLSITTIAGGANGGLRYLLYLRRSRADVFTGPFGGIVRRSVEGRIRSEGPRALDALRRRLESGEPTSQGT